MGLAETRGPIRAARWSGLVAPPRQKYRSLNGNVTSNLWGRSDANAICFSIVSGLTGAASFPIMIPAWLKIHRPTSSRRKDVVRLTSLVAQPPPADELRDRKIDSIVTLGTST